MSGQLTEHVVLTIVADAVGQVRAGFGVALHLSYTAAWVERSRTYGGLSDVAVDFVAGTPEYLAAAAYFGQSPHPEQLIIGRAALKPTQVYVIGVTAVANSTIYALNVAAPGATVTNPLTYTSDSSATNDEIIAGLVTALNGVTGKNYTAAATGTAGSQVCTVTGNVPGNWFSIAVVNYALLTIKQTQADPGIATDLAAIQIENDSWYALHTIFNSTAIVLAAAAWIETQSKIYLPTLAEGDSINVAVGSSPTDTLYQLFTHSYNRTAGSFYPDPSLMFSAAWLGRVLPDEPGSETWKGKTLAGITPVNLSATHRTNLRARKANSYTTIGSENKTWEGTVAGGTYGFIDVTRGLDWIEDDMTKGVFDALFSGEKVPYTNPGIAVVRAAVKKTLKEAARKGIIDDDFDIQVPKVKNVSSANKAIRNLPDVKFTAVLQGAIHTVQINGVVSQ